MVISSLSQVKKTPKQRVFSSTPTLQCRNPSKEFHRVDDLLNSLPQSHVLFLSFLHHKSQFLEEISYSVKTLMKFMGLGERQVQRIIKRLSDLNLIHITRRDHQTNILSLSWIFECEEYKNALSIYFPNDVWYKKAVFSRARDVTLVIVEYYSKSDINHRGDFDIPIWHCLDQHDISRNKKGLTSRTLSSPPRIRFEIRESTPDPLNRKSSSMSLGFVRGVPEANPWREMEVGKIYL